MNVEELLDMLEETLEEGTAVPFAAAKRVVDVDRCRDIVDEVRNNLPDELRDSKKIVADREQILKNAQTDADNIIKQAEERARVLVSDKEITKRAQKMAVELVNAAQAQAKRLTMPPRLIVRISSKTRRKFWPAVWRISKIPA